MRWNRIEDAATDTAIWTSVGGALAIGLIIITIWLSW